MNADLLQRASALDTDEKLDLIEALWDSIVNSDNAPSLTQVQKVELDKRLDEYRQNPDEVISWDDVKAAALAKAKE